MSVGTGAACGKLILLGEHAVVYGAPALVLGIGQQCRATATLSCDRRRLQMLGRVCDADANGDEIARAFDALLVACDAPERLLVEVDGELPAGVGLGYSAASAVAIARAIEALAAGHVDQARVLACAMAWERVFHGNPSGVDVAAAMNGGCTRFIRAAADAPPQTRRVAVPETPLLCVGLTGTRSSTRAMVESVAELRRREPQLVKRSVDSIGVLVDNAAIALEAGDMRALGELMDLNHMLLTGLLLSNDSIEQLCAAARDAGALGAKLTGAGGGGAVVALAGSGKQAENVGGKVVDAWRQLGFEGFRTELGEP